MYPHRTSLYHIYLFEMTEVRVVKKEDRSKPEGYLILLVEKVLLNLS